MFALIKYGVGCTLSIKHTLLDWSWKLVPRCGLAGSSTSGPVLFCLSCFCMGVHARACRRVAFVRAGHMHARWFRWFRPCMRVGFGQGHRTHAGALLSFGRDAMARGRACVLFWAGDAGRMLARWFRLGGMWWRALGGRPSFGRAFSLVSCTFLPPRFGCRRNKFFGAFFLSLPI